ncbi:MAG: type II secretion system protein [Phycisphaerales bacterium]
MSRAHARRGFTMVEAIAAIVVISVLGSIASFVLHAAVRGSMDAATGESLAADASAALERIVRGLRAIDDDGGTPGVQPSIGEVGPTLIRWNTNWSLSRSGTTVLLEESGGTPTALVRDASAFTIQTYNGVGGVLGGTLSGAACHAVRRIEVTLTLARAGRQVALRTRVTPRCTVTGAGG